MSHLGCCYIAAKSLHTAGDDEDALNLLDSGEPLLRKMEISDVSSPLSGELSTGMEGSTLASIYLLKGHILEALDNQPAASEAFQSALRQDVFCYEAFEALVQHQMLSAKEEEDLLSSLPFLEQDGESGIASFVL